METETPAQNTAVNPATDSHAPRQVVPVMDVVPPPAVAPAPAPEPAAGPNPSAIPPVSADVSQQMSEPPVAPEPAPEPEPTPGPGAAATAPIEPVAAPPEDDDTPPPAHAGDSPHELIEQKSPTTPVPESVPESAKAAAAEKPAPATVQVPKHHDPTRLAIIATVVITVVLAMLVVMAYMSSNKA